MSAVPLNSAPVSVYVPGKPEGDDPSGHRVIGLGSRVVLLVSHRTLPPSAGTTVDAGEIEERGAAENPAVAQHFDAVIAPSSAFDPHA